MRNTIDLIHVLLHTEYMKEKRAIIALGARIKELRDKANLSMLEFSKKSGVGASTISSIERGNSDPSLSSLIGIADTLGLSVSELLKDIK